MLIDDELIDMRVDVVLPQLFERVERLVQRQEASDHTYLFLTTRLLLMLTVQSQAAFAFLSVRKSAWEQWLEVRRRGSVWPCEDARCLVCCGLSCGVSVCLWMCVLGWCCRSPRLSLFTLVRV